MMQSALRAIAVCGERMLILAAESRAFVAAIIVCLISYRATVDLGLDVGQLLPLLWAQVLGDQALGGADGGEWRDRGLSR